MIHTNQTIIHIGFPKTGTTYLQTYFELHPDIYHNRDRFKNYYTTGKIDASLLCETDGAPFDILSEELLSIWPGQENDELLQKHNLNYNIQQHQKSVAAGLHALYPNAHILITVRNYSSLVHSLYSQYLFGGGYRSMNYFLKDQSNILNLYNYDFVVKTYQDFFGPNNITILPFEFLAENPKEYMNYIEKKFAFKHLDFPPDKVHSSLNSFSIPIIRCLNYIAMSYLRLIRTKNRKQKFLNYLEWVNNFKEKLSKIGIGKKLKIDASALKLSEFKANSTTIHFDEKLEQYTSLYH